MALRIDLKIRNNSNEHFIEELGKFCKNYAFENDCAIEFDDEEYPDVEFFWWDEGIRLQREHALQDTLRKLEILSGKPSKKDDVIRVGTSRMFDNNANFWIEE